MKKSNFIPVFAALSITVVILIALFFWQFKSNKEVKKIFKDKKRELEKALEASRRLEQMEKQSQQLKLKGETIAKRITLGEKEPLDLIKVITRLGVEKGLKNLKFEVKPVINPEFGTVVSLPAEITPLYFVMEAEATYQQAVDFLAALFNLERVVYVVKVDIKRDEAKSPYQVISLNLAAYSFKEQ